MIDFLGIHWAGIDRIIYLPLVLLIIISIVRNYHRMKHVIRVLVHPLQQQTMFKHFSVMRFGIKAVLLSVSVICIFLALLQPQWGKQEHTVVQEGRDVLIVLDISRSMQAKDLSPTRLDFAKLKIRAFLSKLSTERIGLIVFSGSAFVQCPLTIDHAACLMFLDNVDTELISSSTTSLDKALIKALEVYQAGPERKNKLVVLFTDGEDFSLNLSSVQQQAIQEQLRLFACGVGTPEGAPIPKYDQTGKPVGHETDSSGKVVLSVLNETMLKQLCSDLGGHYVRATYDDGDIDYIANLIKHYEKEKFDDKKMSLFQDQYPWLLGCAWICLALDWIL